MPGIPPELVQRAFLAPITEITRRVEIHEADGETPWRPELWPRVLVGGTISVDMTRDERRSVDVELDNTDGALDPEAGGFWYDKVLKVFYGVRLYERERDPRVVIVEETNAPGQGLALKALLAGAGIDTTLFDPLIVRYDQVAEFDVVVSISSTVPTKRTLLLEAFERGKSVITFAPAATAAELPDHIQAVAPTVAWAERRAFAKLDVPDRVAGGWDGTWVLAGPGSYRPITAVAPGALALLESAADERGPDIAAVLAFGVDGQGWMHCNAADLTAARFTARRDDFGRFLGAVVRRLDYVDVGDHWETQLGEFVADSIEDADEFGDRIRFAGRDYTARCMLSKLSKATMFTATEPIEAVIAAVAANAGVRKISLPITTKTLGKDMTWEADVERWRIIADVALAGNYEIYFTPTGVLTMREQQDPLLTPASLKLTTGDGGNLVSRSAKTSGGQIFNHVVVVGESSDSTVPLVFGEAINNDPASPTSVDRIGQRTKRISSALVTTDAQALDLARTMLSVSALEEFEMSFTAVLLPWIEPGEIVEMVDPDGEYWGPSRYLLSTLSLPLDLGPMSGTAKRVMKVG